jgi:hypothetical protein
MRVPTQLLPRPPDCTEWLDVGPQFWFNIVTSSFPIPFFSFLCNFCLFLFFNFSMMLMLFQLLLINTDQRRPSFSLSSTLSSMPPKVSQVSLLSLTRQVHPFPSRSESAGGFFTLPSSQILFASLLRSRTRIVALLVAVAESIQYHIGRF